MRTSGRDDAEVADHAAAINDLVSDVHLPAHGFRGEHHGDQSILAILGITGVEHELAIAARGRCLPEDDTLRCRVVLD